MISRIKAELLSDEDAKILDADATYGVRLTNKKGDERFVSVQFKETASIDEDYLARITYYKVALVKMFEGDKKIHEFEKSNFSDHRTFSDVLRSSLRSMDNKNVQKLYDKAFGVIYKAEDKKAKLEAKREEQAAKAKEKAQEKANAPFNLGCLNFLRGKGK